MSISLADVRFWYQHGLGLIRRGIVSLRTRGWRASWRRVLRQFRGHRLGSRQVLFAPPQDSFVPFALPASPTPRASIIIPVYNQFAHTLTCLRALAAHPPQAHIEVIVVDDGSSDGTASALLQIEGLHYHRRESNGGFIAACNDGAARALGQILVFLNNDTVPQPGWLDAMLYTFDQHSDAGLVGGQLLYPDGQLQEAGGVVFNDGSSWSYGRFESPDDPCFSYLRDVDYVSGAALAIPRALFAQLGGFDSRYAPAYFEDTDLAFAVRATGKRVLYQPAARIVHNEGATAGTDPRRGAKTYQARNQTVFREHRRDMLTQQLPATITPSPAAIHRAQRQVLIIDALTPQPDHDSGSVRLVNLMRLLISQGLHVVFLPANREHAGRYTIALQQLGVETWYAPFAPRAPAWLRKHGRRFAAILVCRHYVAREFLPLLRAYAPQARIVFDSVDLHYLREQRGAELIGNDELARAAQQTRKLELEVIANSDITFVVSETERALLVNEAPTARVELLSNLHEVSGAGLPFLQRHDLVFVGGFRHPPNVDAVVWFVTNVFPSIRAQAPELRLHCIGSDPPAQIEALAGQSGVLVHGHVANIEPYMNSCRVAVAPLRYGAGVKGKINMSMAHGQPVVATRCAVEGMHLQDGRDVLVADNADDFAEAVLRLYHDETLWLTLSINGLDNVQRHFSMEAARATVRSVFLDT